MASFNNKCKRIFLGAFCALALSATALAQADLAAEPGKDSASCGVLLKVKLLPAPQADSTVSFTVNYTPGKSRPSQAPDGGLAYLKKDKSSYTIYTDVLAWDGFVGNISVVLPGITFKQEYVTVNTPCDRVGPRPNTGTRMAADDDTLAGARLKLTLTATVKKPPEVKSGSGGVHINNCPASVTLGGDFSFSPSLVGQTIRYRIFGRNLTPEASQVLSLTLTGGRRVPGAALPPGTLLTMPLPPTQWTLASKIHPGKVDGLLEVWLMKPRPGGGFTQDRLLDRIYVGCGPLS